MKGDVLSKVAEYLNYYADKDFPVFPESLKSNDLKAEINEWDYTFIEPVSFENCFHLYYFSLKYYFLTSHYYLEYI